MIAVIKQILKRTPALYAWIWYRRRFWPAQSQSNEADILDDLIARFPIPSYFIEFGFGAWEFNCARLQDSFDGLVLDGDRHNVAYASKVLPTRIRCEHAWLDLETIGVIECLVAGRAVGILSVDVDGNDYWLLRRLIGLQPAIVVCEFNPVFGLRPLTVAYDATFERFEKHASGLYYGASLTALQHLCDQHGYTLLGVSSNQVNAFFVRRDLLSSSEVAFDMTYLRRDVNNPAADRFEAIAGLEFVDVTQDGH